LEKGRAAEVEQGNCIGSVDGFRVFPFYVCVVDRKTPSSEISNEWSCNMFRQSFMFRYDSSSRDVGCTLCQWPVVRDKPIFN
jgi:hypothetical protein